MSDVERFLIGKDATLVSYVSWGRQNLDFDVATYFSSDIPPSNLITSVRAIVQHDGIIM